jgi:hypothetical protein
MKVRASRIESAVVEQERQSIQVARHQIGIARLLPSRTERNGIKVAFARQGLRHFSALRDWRVSRRLVANGSRVSGVISRIISVGGRRLNIWS